MIFTISNGLIINCNNTTPSHKLKVGEVGPCLSDTPEKYITAFYDL